MENNIENVKKNPLTKLVDKTKSLIHKDKPDFTAEYAWIETTYGQGSYRTLEERIKEKQDYIKHIIKSKFPARSEGYQFSNANGSYRCVVDIEEDLSGVVEEIFKPFIDGGFKIINLSDKIDEIEDEHVYLISWKKIFKDLNNGNN